MSMLFFSSLVKSAGAGALVAEVRVDAQLTSGA
jgi:hypothetical protein